MSEFRRILTTEADDFERSLLRSADRDVPNKGARERVLTALDLNTTAEATSASAGGSTAAGAGRIGAASKGGVALLKWVGVMALAAGATWVIVAVIGAHATRPREPEQTWPLASGTGEPPVRQAETESEPPTAATIPVAEPPHETQPPPRPVTLPNATHPARRAVPAVPATAEPSALAVPASQEASALADEVAALDAAREALRAHSPAGAIRALDAYASRFPAGVLAPEAVVVRIEALVALGDRTQAEQLGRRFLAAHPTSPLADRVRQMLNP